MRASFKPRSEDSCSLRGSGGGLFKSTPVTSRIRDLNHTLRSSRDWHIDAAKTDAVHANLVFRNFEGKRAGEVDDVIRVAF
jgi:hypothetical protein